MKVTKEQPPTKFEPITIVLETEEEAELMWAMLNISPVDFDACCKRCGVKVRYSETKRNMFLNFNDLFTAKKLL
jgi:uncharacterized metal-binding protein